MKELVKGFLVGFLSLEDAIETVECIEFSLAWVDLLSAFKFIKNK